MKRGEFLRNLTALCALPLIPIKEKKQIEAKKTQSKPEIYCAQDQSKYVLQECDYKPSGGVSRVMLFNREDLSTIEFEGRGNWLDYPVIK